MSVYTDDVWALPTFLLAREESCFRSWVRWESLPLAAEKIHSFSRGSSYEWNKQENTITLAILPWNQIFKVMCYYTHSHSDGSQAASTLLILLGFTLEKNRIWYDSQNHLSVSSGAWTSQCETEQLVIQIMRHAKKGDWVWQVPLPVL